MAVTVSHYVQAAYSVPEMFDGFDEFQFFGCLPWSGSDLVENGEGSSIGESVGVFAFVRADFRPARKTRHAEFEIGADGAKNAQSRNVLLTVMAVHVRERSIGLARHCLSRESFWGTIFWCRGCDERQRRCLGETGTE